MSHTRKFRPGDLVEVKMPLEVLATLDRDGTLDGLPFMPEMINYTGKRFRVCQRVLKTCISIKNSTNMRVLKSDDVVTLQGLRCSGTGHDGCQKGCMIFWREAWLRAAEGVVQQPAAELMGKDRLRARLKTSTEPQIYFCQASELLRYTNRMPRLARLLTCVKDVRAGNCSALEMCRRIGTWLFWRIRKMIAGEYAAGTNARTPTEPLELSSGDMIEVKALDEIVRTTNRQAQNRGLYFSPDMAALCGQKAHVTARLDKIIVDGTGEMRELQNTVYLEKSMCGCSHVALGGCSRGEFAYWREAWLRRQEKA